jgi:hypothetical protein
MEEILTGIIKGAGLIIRGCLEGGIWEISVRKPGRFLLKIIWPPYWFKQVPNDSSLNTLFGIIFWLVMSYLAYYMFKMLNL